MFSGPSAWEAVAGMRPITLCLVSERWPHWFWSLRLQPTECKIGLVVCAFCRRPDAGAPDPGQSDQQLHQGLASIWLRLASFDPRLRTSFDPRLRTPMSFIANCCVWMSWACCDAPFVLAPNAVRKRMLAWSWLPFLRSSLGLASLQPTRVLFLVLVASSRRKGACWFTWGSTTGSSTRAPTSCTRVRHLPDSSPRLSNE